MAGSREKEKAWRARGGAAGDVADKPFGRHLSVLSGFAPLQRSSIIKKLHPDQKGALRLAERFGDRLVCVRYRTDHESGRRFTTVEIVVEERTPAEPARHTAWCASVGRKQICAAPSRNWAAYGCRAKNSGRYPATP